VLAVTEEISPDEVIIIPWDDGLGVMYSRRSRQWSHAGIRLADWPFIDRAEQMGKLIFRGGDEVRKLFEIAKHGRSFALSAEGDD
jgi:hypothetical protein